MPRSPRIAFENAFYHIFNRGIAYQKIFQEEGDYHKFLKRLEDLKIKNSYDHAIYVYVLMPTHFHLLIQTKKTPLAKIMTSLLTSYSMYFNRKYHRIGTLFQNRYKSKLCSKDNYFLGASRYILLNPIEAKICRHLKDYSWSSYQEVFGNSRYRIIDYEEVARLIGDTEREKNEYHEFLLEGIEMIESLKNRYSFSRDIEGNPKFNTLSQKKYLRRKFKNKTNKTN